MRAHLSNQRLLKTSSQKLTCIMHSSLVGFLNTVFSKSAYFGFTNSGMTPLVFSRADRDQTIDRDQTMNFVSSMIVSV